MSRALVLLVCLLVSTVSCEKQSKPAPTVEPWVPVAGLPLPGHGAPEPELALRPADWVPPFDELTGKRLIEIGYQFHPRISAEHDMSPQEGQFLFFNASERIAMQNAQYAAWQRIATWRGLVAAVRKQMPAGSRSGDQTIPGHDAAYFATFVLPDEQEGTWSSSVTVHLSYIVPFYTHYTKRSRLVKYPTRERWEVDSVGTHTSPEIRSLIEIITNEIGMRYGYREVDESLLGRELPGLHIEGGRTTRAPTLMDALFSAYKPSPAGNVD
ncbi:hypothetical protein [Haliangium sp.]|uniref:hypothetical protein n=1 Tax=Haliangium sp. TaxID=2663208 RepID=UPI003D0E4495